MAIPDSQKFIYTLKICKAMQEYHRKRDPLQVMEVLGHKNIQTTIWLHTSLSPCLQKHEKKQFVTTIASTKEERIALKNEGSECWQKDRADW